MVTSPGGLGRGSRSLSNRAMRLDLPLPVRPQMAIFSPARIVRLMSRRARLVVSVAWSSDLFGELVLLG
jgi:hypothetical protein